MYSITSIFFTTQSDATVSLATWPLSSLNGATRKAAHECLRKSGRSTLLESPFARQSWPDRKASAPLDWNQRNFEPLLPP